MNEKRVHAHRNTGNLVHFKHFKLKRKLVLPTLCLLQKPVSHLVFYIRCLPIPSALGLCFHNFLYLFLSKLELNCFSSQQPVKSQGPALVSFV